MPTAAPAEPFASLSVGELLERLAAETPAPGGGPAAGLVTAMAAALVSKVARASRDGWEEAGGAAAQALALRDRAERLAREDVDAHMAAVAALDPPPGEPPSDGELGAALAYAADVPLLIAGSAADTAALAHAAALHGHPDRRPDAQAAAILAASAARAAALLVEANLATLPDDPRCAAAVERVRAAEAAVAAAHTQA